MKPETLTIKRSEWLRGEATDTKLESPTGKCCLGFLGYACGAIPGSLLDYGFPWEAPEVNWPLDPHIDVDLDPYAPFVDANDDEEITEEEREEKLIALFDEKLEIKLNFID